MSNAGSKRETSSKIPASSRTGLGSFFASDRFRYPSERVYVSRNHQWAYAAWEMARLADSAKFSSGGATLLHVDAHLDDTWDGVLAEGLFAVNSPQSALEVAGRLEIDNFIWAGWAAGVIDRVVYVCPKGLDDSDPFDLSGWNLTGEQLRPLRDLLAKKAYTGHRFESVRELREGLGSSGDVRKLLAPQDQPVILDLDLDVFKLYPERLEDRELMPDDRVREELVYLRDLYPYDLLTVALSPSFCGGEENSARLLGLVREVFGLAEEESVPW